MNNLFPTLFIFNMEKTVRQHSEQIINTQNNIFCTYPIAVSGAIRTRTLITDTTKPDLDMISEALDVIEEWVI